MAACLAGAGCKQVIVTAPLVVWLYDRTFLAGSFGRALRRRWGLYLGLLTSWVLLAGLLYAAREIIRITLDLKGVTGPSYALSQGGVILHYLKLAFWPAGLSFDYGWPVAQSAAEILPGTLALLGLAGLSVWAVVRRPAWGFLGAWFFLLLAPSSSLMPLPDLAFEHRMYLALAGIVAAVVLGVGLLLQRATLPKYVPLALVLVVVTALAVRTYRRNLDYRSDLALWSGVIQACPWNGRGHCFVGMAYAGDKQAERAIEEYRIALTWPPVDTKVYNNLGAALFSQNDFAGAIEQFHTALGLEPLYPKGRANLGLALLRNGTLDEAIVELRRALELDPGNREARKNLSEAENKLGAQFYSQSQWEEAVRHYTAAATADPAAADAQQNLGMALWRQGKMAEALAALTEAVRLDPQFFEAHFHLALLFQAQHQTARAIPHFRAALNAKPDHAETAGRLAWILATYPDSNLRDGQGAVQLAKKACELTAYKFAMALDALAAACAETGDFQAALTHAQKGIDLARTAGDENLAASIRTHLETYRAGRPYRDTGN